jgi:hypothetical protein
MACNEVLKYFEFNEMYLFILKFSIVYSICFSNTSRDVCNETISWCENVYEIIKILGILLKGEIVKQ